MNSSILDGILVRVLTDEHAAAVCVLHLRALGASTTTATTTAADIVLADRHSDLSEDVGAAFVCTFETHEVDGGVVTSETTAQAAIGLTDYVGPVDGPAARLGCDVGTVVTGICAVQAILAWLHGGRASGTRHDVAVSPLRTLSTLKTILWAARSRPDDWVGTHVRSRDRLVDSGYRTRDGRITLDFPIGAQESWIAFVAELGLDAHASAVLAERWHESVGWGDDVDLARPLYEKRLQKLSTDDAVELVRRNGGSSVPFQTLAECLDHPQSRALGLSSGAPSDPYRIQAFGRLRLTASGRDPERPLADVRVVDFGVGGVGPFAATLLAWLGADVVKVEAPNEFILDVRPTVGGLSTTYLALNQGKRSVRLDLKDAADRELARGLVADADVVIENFRPGALARIGFGFDELTAFNPRLIHCSVTGFGGVGPLAGEPCTDPHMQAFSGFAMANADEAGLPRRIRYYGFVDLVTSTVAAEAVCAALLTRAVVGGPVRVETSMLEAVTDVLRTSAQLPRHELDGLFRARDGDVAVTCRSADELAALNDVLGLEPRLDRKSALDALERRLAALPAAEVVRLLGARDVAAAAVARDEDVLTSDEYRHARLVRTLPVPHGDPLTAGGPPWLGSGGVPSPSAPLPGADTAALRADPPAFWRKRYAPRA
jgi:crotonobetainyl-CoA:carnitine CoA-transferase CaiB-like acyl-CoA transferase